MNRLCKVLLTISILLSVALVIVFCLYLNAAKLCDYYTDGCIANADLLCKTNLAIQSAGFRIDLQEDGSFKLVEEITE